MGVLKRKEERSETITLRVPASVKHDLSELRGRAEAAGFDLSATIVEALARLLKQAREELSDATHSGQIARRRLSNSAQSKVTDSAIGMAAEATQ